MRKLILRNHQSPGDIVMLTAAVRDLHRCHPGEFKTDVRSSCPALWENNPFITPLAEGSPGVEVIECHYPLVHRSNQEPCHFLHGFVDFFNRELGTRITPTAFHGDIHLSVLERFRASRVKKILGDQVPFWIINAGGKFDFTVKWWERSRYQAVVDHFKGRILFVQVGEAWHNHPALDGVIDLRGATDLRQLVLLVHHSQGGLGPVSLPMHLAAAVEMAPRMPKNRPYVVIAGGREPPHWTAYPHHQFIHTVGTLRCCDNGGCWKARTMPLGDGDERDRPENLCVDVVNGLPRCMDMISPAEVIGRVERYFDGGAIDYLSPSESELVAEALGRVPHPVSRC